MVRWGGFYGVGKPENTGQDPAKKESLFFVTIFGGKLLRTHEYSLYDKM